MLRAGFVVWGRHKAGQAASGSNWAHSKRGAHWLGEKERQTDSERDRQTDR